MAFYFLDFSTCQTTVQLCSSDNNFEAVIFPNRKQNLKQNWLIQSISKLVKLIQKIYRNGKILTFWLWNNFKSKFRRMLKAPPLKSSDLHISVLQDESVKGAFNMLEKYVWKSSKIRKKVKNALCPIYFLETMSQCVLTTQLINQAFKHTDN